MKNTAFRKILMAKGLTPKSIANAGMPYGTVLAHYYGKRNMSLTTAKRYAKILNITLSQFLDEDFLAQFPSSHSRKIEDA